MASIFLVSGHFFEYGMTPIGQREKQTISIVEYTVSKANKQRDDHHLALRSYLITVKQCTHISVC